MKFSVQLSPYYPDKGFGGKRLCDDMLELAVTCDRLGYESVSLTEHHLINILLMPAPLHLAIKIADATEHIAIMTAVVVLPLHDMRVYAGELIIADILTDGRLLLGASRGAFEFETSRMGVPLAITKEKFDESLDVLTALLSREEVSWDGKYYQFEPLTIQPRPMRDIPIMMACATPKSTYHSARRGFHIQTTPLAGDREHVLNLVDAFQRGRAECGERGAELTLTMSRIGLIVHDERRRKAREELAQHYYSQFDNVFTGPGRVSHGFIEPLPREQTTEQLAANLLICTPGEMVDRVAPYAEEGVDRFVLNPNFGASQSEMLETLQCFAEEVMPHFADRDAAAGAKAGAAE